MALEKKRGFTLIEALVVVALFAVIGVSLFSSFYMGLKIWKRASSPRRNYYKALIGLERLSADLRRSTSYPGIGFFGNRTTCSFANIVSDKILNVTYEFDEASGVLARSHMSRKQMLDFEEPPKPQAVIARLKNFSFGFYGFNVTSGNFTFLDSWNSTAGSGLPKFVKVTVTLEDERELEKYITIPQAL